MVTNSSTDTPTGASGTILQGQGIGTATAFSTATYPSTTTAQQLLYSTATNTVGELTTANSKLPATNSSGTLAMRAFSVVTQTFTSNGTYTPTPGMLYCVVEVVGGGGGGGGTSTTGATTVSNGSGGGGGGYCRKTISAATIGASQAVTVGAGGTAGAVGGGTGGTGGTSSLGALLQATGGAGGIGSSAGTSAGSIGGSAGVGSGGDLNASGQVGGFSQGNNSLAFQWGGTGGNSIFGGGPQGRIGGGGQEAGTAGLNYGSGGSGGFTWLSSTQVTGGAGAPGIVIVTEYVIA